MFIQPFVDFDKYFVFVLLALSSIISLEIITQK